ncbi:hypothetical protein JOC95_002025 [Bacillus tianshenii]|uniref:TRASH domain-containing protein n=1 Tax=Sutcliffiella tianshenii TaxID=1463404 RepID=A0ABS2NZN3_9BACI|nr:hypothetical protein [Bacillus tianshenii]MBM7620172.1 hypothetical protein [Bacillus tianshenii]
MNILRCKHCNEECNTYSYCEGNIYYCSYRCQDEAKRNCLICNMPFTKNASSYSKYCSKECNGVATKKIIYSPKNCDVCKKELAYNHPLTDFYGAEVFYACSEECKKTYFRDNPPNWQAWKS